MVYRKDVPQTKLVGVCGEKFHGKDTFADLVCGIKRKFFGKPDITANIYQKLYFAGRLKEICRKVYGLTDEQLTNPKLKEVKFQYPIYMDNFLSALSKEVGFKVKPRIKWAYTPRELMQYLGTEYIRSMRPNYWVNCLGNQIDATEGNYKFIIPDTRFENEAKIIKDRNGIIVKVVRLDMPPAKDKHASEAGLPDEMIDIIVAARTGELEIMQKVASLIVMGKFTSAKYYDYRGVLKAIQAYQDGEPLSVCARHMGKTRYFPNDAFDQCLKYYKVPLRDPYAALKM